MNYLENQIMVWDSSKLSDHNRSPLQESYDVIERRARMANGLLRAYVVARKRNWQVSWSNIPSHNEIDGAGTVDGGMSGQDMEDFYETHAHIPFNLTLQDGAGNQSIYLVMFSSFSKDVVKRGAVDWWDVSISMEEC